MSFNYRFSPFTRRNILGVLFMFALNFYYTYVKFVFSLDIKPLIFFVAVVRWDSIFSCKLM